MHERRAKVLDRLAVWEEEHDAQVSTKVGSTEYIVFGQQSGRRDVKLTFKGELLRRAKDGVIRFLGVYVDEGLNFNAHVQHVREQLDRRRLMEQVRQMQEEQLRATHPEAARDF